MNLKNKDLLQAAAYINGEWVKGASQFDVTNPATGDVIARVADLGAAETQAAIDAADAAFKPWAALKAKERAAILIEWQHLIMENLEDLAQIMTAEMGKPLAEARGEIGYGASFIGWFAEEGKRAYGDIIPNTVDSLMMRTLMPRLRARLRVNTAMRGRPVCVPTVFMCRTVSMMPSRRNIPRAHRS